jgi:LuxR family maltose regulon positive regulatory protein
LVSVASATEAPPGPLLVQTKLEPPARRELVPRPELVERLAGGGPRRLTVLSAPAGWGKTTMLAAWAASDHRPFAWLSLDAGDSQVGRFWTYLVAALQSVEPGVGAQALGLVTAPGVDVEREALPVLLNDLAGLRKPIVLALDDYHLIRSSELHAQMAFFVERLPPNCEVAIATRAEPPLPLARMRVRGEALKVDAAQLRISPEETDALLNDLLRLELRPDQVQVLLRRTEGWAAGLYLAALSLRHQPDAGGFIDAFAGNDRHIVDYLGSEVLAGLPYDVREFLLRTSVLDRLSAPLCDALTGGQAAARLLPEIERSNLFLVPLDDRREWYRYHHLFAELLRLELTRVHPDAAPELHRRAAAWYLERGDPDRAIRHTIAAGDHHAAAELIAAHWTAWILERGEHGDVDAWLGALPRDVVRSDARLCVARMIVAQSTGKMEGAEEWVGAADAALGPDAGARLRTDVAAVRSAFYVIAGDAGTASAIAGPAIDRGARDSVWYPVAYGARAHARRWSGDPEGALEDFDGYVRESAARNQILSVISTTGSLALMHAEARRWREAQEAANRALEMTQHMLGEHWMMGNTHTALTLLHAHRGDKEAALAAGARAVELVRRGGVPGDRANTLLTVAALHHEAGDESEAVDLVEEARGILARCADPGSLIVERLERAERTLRPRSAIAAHEAEPGEELTDRELAVLRLMSTRLSQREIGHELYVSVNTVKTHSRNLFRKLGASGRDEAVARARKLGLL